jgi:ceramide glucosyltransferase
MVVSLILGALAVASLGLTLWQWLEARAFPLHQRTADTRFAPALTVLKPLKGADAQTAACLRSWLVQDYAGPVQTLLGIATGDDPAGEVARRLLAEFPQADARLLVCPDKLGANAKVSTLIQLEAEARHDVLVISDADVRVPRDFLANLVVPLRAGDVGLVNPLYRLAAAGSSWPMRWEALAINADFWSSVLQARRLEPMRFALGAVMAIRRAHLRALGGFAAVARHLADDFELGRRVAAQGAQVALCPVVVDCCHPVQGWAEVWRHQVRWARTIRACRPGAYALSLLSNATLWPLLWLLFAPGPTALAVIMPGACLAVRMLTAADNQRRLTQSLAHLPWCWLALAKDLLQVLLWALAFAGNTVEWRGERFRVTRHGELEPLRES